MTRFLVVNQVLGARACLCAIVELGRPGIALRRKFHGGSPTLLMPSAFMRTRF